MKILWLTNVILPIVCKEIDIPITVLGGWMDNLALRLSKCYEMIFVFPYGKESIKGSFNNVKYYGFSVRYDERYFENIIKNEKPDIIHVWGTEMKHSLLMIKASQKCGMLDNTVVSIQGLVHLIAEYHYFANLPFEIIKANTIRDLLTNNNIYKQCKRFKENGKREIDVLKTAKHVVGRTNWDYESVRLVNCNVKYHFCYESLRDPFYNRVWDIQQCNPKQIYMGQGHYPLKGLHMVLHALRYVIQVFPDIRLIVVANDVYRQPFWKISSYQLYIKKLINDYNLRNNVIFCAKMNAEQVSETICKSRIFLNASSIENSSNSLGEAMLLGCPSIASNVGGTSSLITNGVDGLLYPFNEPYILADRIINLLSDDNLSKYLSYNAKQTAKVIFDRDKNYETTLDIYSSIKND